MEFCKGKKVKAMHQGKKSKAQTADLWNPGKIQGGDDQVCQKTQQ
jgi:hypothetical protein